MPIYEYKCECGRKFDRVLPLARYDEKQECSCGKIAEKQLSAPMIQVDIPAYISPASGKHINSRSAMREDMASTGCVEYDPGLKEENNRRLRNEELALEKSLDETVEKTIHEMPARKREKLTAELESGVSLDYARA